RGTSWHRDLSCLFSGWQSFDRSTWETDLLSSRGTQSVGPRKHVPAFEDLLGFGMPNAELTGIEKLAMISRTTSADQFKE
ncbi:MAG: hypothetical protein VXZ53_15310, partial [Planctomycetota bacterium]|nr:hypothetical protein [Planctomycetota bacterium]